MITASSILRGALNWRFVHVFSRMCVITGPFAVHIRIRFRSQSEANRNTHLISLHKAVFTRNSFLKRSASVLHNNPMSWPFGHSYRETLFKQKGLNTVWTQPWLHLNTVWTQSEHSLGSSEQVQPRSAVWHQHPPKCHWWQFTLLVTNTSMSLVTVHCISDKHVYVIGDRALY